MIVHKLGLVPYEKALHKMNEIHSAALKDGKNHLIVCQHPEIYTLGQDAWKQHFDVQTYKTDRGGSITSHSPGQNIYYFCFHSPFPARFFAQVICVFETFFADFLPQSKYDRDRPGFYIDSRKLLSLGFRYTEGVSLHGVALNVAVDLAFHNKINPCALEGIRATSLEAEGLNLSCESVDEYIITQIQRVFDEPL